MTYGDIPAAEHQQRMHEQALSRFDRLDIDIAVSDEKRYHAPLHVEEHYALDETGDLSNKTHIVIGWLLGHSTNLKEQLEAHLLDGVLLDDSASPLRHALETTELGNAPSPLCGLEPSNREMSFICGLEGSRAEHADALEKLVLDVLGKVADEGIPAERVEAVLHQLELSQREISGDGYPYGLQLILEGLSSAIHRGSPAEVLNLDPVLDELREQIRDPDYIPRLIRERLLENQHRVRLTLVPDAGLATRRDQAEAQRLEAVRSRMDEAQKLRVVEQAGALADRQQQIDDPSVLPKVGLEDIPPQLHIAEGETGTLAGSPASYYAQGTNGLVYQQVLADLPRLDEDLLDILPLYTNALTQLGCAGNDYLAVQALQTSVSGGISAASSMRGGVRDVQALKGYFILSGKALVRNHAALSGLMRDTLVAPRFDELARIRELIAQQRARREQSVTGNGHGLAMLAASSGLSSGAALAHRLRGLAGIKYLKELDETLAGGDALQSLAGRFDTIHTQMLEAPRQFLLIAEAERLDQARGELQRAWSDQAGTQAGFSGFAQPRVQRQVREAWLANTQVNFCARAFPAVPLEHEDAAALSVLAGFLRNGYLHRTIREQGGAYGGGASFDSDNAAFRFFSYRDPRLEETLGDFDRAVAWLHEHEPEWRMVEEAILGVVSSIDKPGSPAGEAKDAFYNSLYGRTPELRRHFRQQVLEVSLDDLRRVGGTYLDPARASTAVICSSSAQARCEALGLEVNQL
jgi:Zn-dependent M16 (insulinase) family peptidase